MENLHRKISGYRELNQGEIDLMNEIKEKGRELIELQRRVYDLPLGSDLEDKSFEMRSENIDALESMQNQRAMWAYQSGINIETGVMQLVRAVALPN